MKHVESVLRRGRQQGLQEKERGDDLIEEYCMHG
jgi:hypothetical protein